MRVPCEDLDLAYEVWRGSPRSIVGYMPRIHLRRKNGKLEYRCWWRVWWHGLYSIILTKAAILHHDYFELYSQPHHAMVRNLVDRRRNCEDIAMQFLVANTTMLPPIYVKVSLVLISIDASCIWLYIHVEVLLQSKHLAPCFPSGFWLNWTVFMDDMSSNFMILFNTKLLVMNWWSGWEWHWNKLLIPYVLLGGITQGHVDDLGVLGGISTSQNVAQAGHMRDRSSCLNDLERIYHSMPLVASHMIVDTANNGWTNAPANLYEYLSSDLWKWWSKIGIMTKMLCFL